MIAVPIGAAILLLALRWSHFLFRTRRIVRASGASAIRHELPVTLLTIGYGLGVAAFALQLLALTHGRPVLSIAWTGVSLLAVGCALRVEGLEALGGAFSFGSAPVSPAPVQTGIFRWMKHPLLTGYVAEVLGLALLSPPHWLIGVTAFAVTLAGAVLQARREATNLRASFGEAWTAHSRRRLL